jgi:hypothetical protein
MLLANKNRSLSTHKLSDWERGPRWLQDRKLKKENLQDFLRELPPSEACLVLKGGRPDDVASVMASIKGRHLLVLREREFVQADGLSTLIVSIPPQSLHDLILELAAKGVGGELIGYEAGEERADWFVSES